MGLAADLATEDEGGGAAGSRLLQGRFVFFLNGLTDATDVSSGFKEIVAMPQILASPPLQIRRAVQIPADPTDHRLGGGQAPRRQQYEQPIRCRLKPMHLAVTGDVVDSRTGAGI